MPFELNVKIKDLSPYEPITGSYRVRMDANESFLAPSEEMMEKITKIVSKVHFNRYPDPYAVDLCTAFANYYRVNPDTVTAGNGSDELISVITNAFLQKNDKVMCFTPDFSMYEFYAYISECRCIDLPKNERFEINIDNAIETANREGVRMIIFSNPCNPTSKVLDRVEVIRLIEGVNALVVLDEAYMDFSDQSLMGFAEKYDNLIILRTCSKAAGMAAIRLGFAVANRRLTDAIRSVKSPYNVNSVTQAIGCELFEDYSYFKYSVERINSSRDMLAEEMIKLAHDFPDKIEVIGYAANFVYAKMCDADKLFDSMLKEGIVVRHFNDYLRITAGRNHENMEATEAIRKFYS